MAIPNTCYHLATSLPNLLADHMGVLRKKKTSKGRPAAPPQADRLTGSKMSLTPSLESASLALEDDGEEQEDGDGVNLSM